MPTTTRRSFLAAAPPIAAAALTIPSPNAAADALPPAFAAALADYQAAHANAISVGKTATTDEELDCANDALVRSGVALVTTSATGAASARELLRVAIERIKADIPADDFDLDPSNPYGLEDRIDVALIVVALSALEADQ